MTRSSRPQFALFLVHYNMEDGSRTASVEGYYASHHGAIAAAIRLEREGISLSETSTEVRSLQPGLVYNFVANRWEDGLEWKRWFGQQLPVEVTGEFPVEVTGEILF